MLNPSLKAGGCICRVGDYWACHRLRGVPRDWRRRLSCGRLLCVPPTARGSMWVAVAFVVWETIVRATDREGFHVTGGGVCRVGDYCACHRPQGVPREWRQCLSCGRLLGVPPTARGSTWVAAVFVMWETIGRATDREGFHVSGGGVCRVGDYWVCHWPRGVPRDAAEAHLAAEVVQEAPLAEVHHVRRLVDPHHASRRTRRLKHTTPPLTTDVFKSLRQLRRRPVTKRANVTHSTCDVFVINMY